MAVVVFESPIDDATLSSIEELRMLRIEVLQRQIQQIDKVVETLLQQGAFAAEERAQYREVILAELHEKCREIRERLDDRETVYSEELELYLDVLTTE